MLPVVAQPRKHRTRQRLRKRIGVLLLVCAGFVVALLVRSNAQAHTRSLLPASGVRGLSGGYYRIPPTPTWQSELGRQAAPHKAHA